MSVEKPVVNTRVSYQANKPSTDSVSLIGSVCWTKGAYDHEAIKNLGPNNVDNSFLKPSIVSSRSTPLSYIDPITYTYVPKIVGNEKIYSSASNNFSFSIHDKANLPHWEEGDKHLKGWIDATTGDTAISYVSLPKEIGIFESAERRVYSHSTMTPLNLFVTDSIVSVPSSKVGIYFSKNANLKSKLRNILYDERGIDPVTAEYFEFMKSKGLKNPKTISGIGTEKMDAIAAVYLNGDEAVFVQSSDIREKARAIAESHGLDGKEAIDYVERYIFYHELYHVAQNIKGRSRANIEAEVEGAEHEFFSNKAAEGGKRARIYQALSEEAGAHVEFYRKNGKVGKKLGYSKGDLAGMLAAYKAEAYADGMDEEEAVKYAHSMLEEELNEEVQEEGGLEEMVEDSEKQTFENENPDNTPYDNGEIDDDTADGVEVEAEAE